MNKLIYITLFALLPLLSGCGQPELENSVEIPRVKVFKLTESGSELEEGRMFFPAVANAADRAHLSFRVAGEITRIKVNEGDLVKKGDLIAEIDPNDYKLEVDNSRASFNVADSQYRRSEALVNKGLLAQSQFDELAAQRMIAKAKYDLAKLRLSFTQLRAPMDGIISRVSAEQHENIQAGQQIVNIHDHKNVDIVIQVADRLFVTTPTEEELERVEVDVKVGNGNLYTASLKEFTTEPDPNTATYNVTLTMPMPSDQLILDGMAVEVAPKDEIVGNMRGGVRIPIEAVFIPDGEALEASNKYVWVVNKNNSVEKRKVSSGRISYDKIQILDGISIGEQVVVAGVARLRNQMTVEPIAVEAE